MLLKQIGAQCVLDGGNVIFIDFQRQFNVHRFYEVLKSMAGSDDDEQRLEQAAGRMSVHCVCSVVEALQLVEALALQFENDTAVPDLLLLDDVGLSCSASELM